MSHTRVAVVQIDFHPAALVDRHSPLADPLFQLNAPSSLLPVSGLVPAELNEPLEQLRARVRREHNRCLMLKLRAVLERCLAWGVKLVVLPEYSVGAELLPELSAIAPELVVVAGTHAVERTLLREGIYAQLGWPEAPRSGMAVAPVLHRGRLLALQPKLSATKPELGNLVCGDRWDPIEFDLGGGPAIPGPLGVMICLDFLFREQVGPGLDRVRFLAVPSYTPWHSAGEFAAEAWQEARRYGRPVLWANVASQGGSSIFVDEGQVGELQNYPRRVGLLERGDEGVIVADVDLGFQRPGGSTRYGGDKVVKPVAVASLLYRQHPIGDRYAEWVEEFERRLDTISEDEAADLVEDARTLLLEAASLSAGQARTKRLRRLLAEVAGINTNEEFRKFTREVVLPDAALPLDVLRKVWARECADIVFEWTRTHRGAGLEEVEQRLRAGGKLEVEAELWTDAGRRALRETSEAIRGSAGVEALAEQLRRATVDVLLPQAFVGLPSASFRPTANLRDIFVSSVELRERVPEGRKLAVDTLGDPWLGKGLAKAVVLGDPGSGKSMLCRYLAVEAAEREQGPVPILLTVRDWAAQGAREGILEFACRHLAQHLSIRCDMAILEVLARVGRLVLLIDGVDETGAQERVQLRDRLRAFVLEYPAVGMIVTSRIIGYDDAAFGEKFKHYVLEPFDAEQLRAFVSRWYALAEPIDPSKRQQREADLWTVLEEPRIMALASNPLLATLIAAVHSHHAQLPGDRAKLYGMFIDLMVVTWPAAGGRGLRDLEGAAQLPMLEELALWMQSERPSGPSNDEREAILINGEQFEGQLVALLGKHRQDLDIGRRRELARCWRIWLVRDSGLMQELQTDRFGFLYLSLVEYLAAQAALREHEREGIAQFVVERHRRTQWRETLLLMVGSRSDDRALGNAVFEQLLAKLNDGPRSWRTCMFMLSLLHEDVEVGPELRIRALDAAADLSCAEQLFGWTSRWESARSRLADIHRFSRKHRAALEQWVENGISRRRGDALLGQLVILPEEFLPMQAVMENRSDEDLGLDAVLDLDPSHPWRVWAAQRAHRATWLAWHRRMPVARVIHRLVDGLQRPEPWICAVMRRSNWLAQCIQRGAENLLASGGGGGLGVPVGMRWASGSSEYVATLTVSTSSTHDTHFSKADTRDFTDQGARHQIWPLALNMALDMEQAHASPPSILRDIILCISTHFDENLIERIVASSRSDFSAFFTDHAVESLALYFVQIFEQSITPLSIAREINLSMAKPPTFNAKETPSSHLATRTSEAFTPILVSFIAEAHAGILLAPSGEPAHLLAEARVQNRWLNLFLDSLVDHVSRESLRPQHQALFLALGLAQFQTTWSWPAGPHWSTWFTIAPPDYWLAAYVWHLCWAVGEPTNPEHLAHAEACLERGHPELVWELRKYPILPTPPDVFALFDGSGGVVDSKPSEVS